MTYGGWPRRAAGTAVYTILARLPGLAPGLVRLLNGIDRLPLRRQAALLGLLVPRLTRLLPLGRLLPLLAGSSVRRPPPSDPRRLVEQVFRLTDPSEPEAPAPGATCLPRALTRFALIARSGVPGYRFVMGLCPGSSEIEGHAWVEDERGPVGERLDREYRITFSFPSGEADR